MLEQSLRNRRAEIGYFKAFISVEVHSKTNNKGDSYIRNKSENFHDSHLFVNNDSTVFH